MDRPRYMNVPSPAPCHVNVAGVGKQSVWGLRIIACISIITLASFFDFVNTPKCIPQSAYPKVQSLQKGVGDPELTFKLPSINPAQGLVDFCAELALYLHII